MATPTPDVLVAAFQQTFSATEDVRKGAEALLKQFEKVQGYAVSLLQVASSDVTDIAVRQASSIYLKNYIKRRWDSKEDTIHESDKNTIKDNLVDVLIRVPPKVKIQIAAVITDISCTDFPAKWPSFLPKVASLISSQNPALIHGAVLALHRAIKVYQYMRSEDKRRSTLYSLVQEVFPTLLQLFSALVVHDTAESGELLKLICKIVEAATKMSMAPHLADPNVMAAWMNALLQAFERPIPEAGLGIANMEDEERGKHPLWKVKKWVSRIMERFIKRYGASNDKDSVENRQFGRAFLSSYAVRVMGSTLQLLSIRRGGAGFLPARVSQSLISYLTACLRHGVTFVALKPHLPALTQDILFPFLWLSAQDMELWQDDPHEYLRKETDFEAEFFNPRNATMIFFADLITYRGKNHLHQLMSYVVSVLVSYENTPVEKRRADLSMIRAKDGALVVIGTLAPYLKRVKEYKANLENMLLVHVFPELTSPVGFLRARSTWIFSQFFNAVFQNPANFGAGLRQVVTMMRDPDLPVRVQAALSLRFLILNKSAKDELRPVLPQILEEYFKLMSEIDNDELVSTLESLIDQYGEEMAPYALGLCQRLAEVFLRLYNQDDEEDMNDAPFECLGAISSLLRGLKHVPHLFPHLEVPLLPMIHKGLEEDAIGYLEEILFLVVYLTYYPQEVTPQLWSVFPKIIQAANDFAIDFIEHMVAPLDNFITRGSTVFFTPGTPYLDMIMALYKKVVADPTTNESDAGDGCRLVESVMHNCKGKTEPRVDQLLPELLDIAVTRLGVAQTTELKILLIETIANALYYNPPITLHVLQAKGAVQSVFTQWFQAIPKFKTFFDKKIIVLGLSSVFAVGYNNLPQEIKLGSKQILETLVQLITQTEEHRKDKELKKLDDEHSKELKKRESIDEEDEDDGVDPEAELGFQEVADDEDVGVGEDDDDDEIELDILASQYTSQLREGGSLGDDDDEAEVVEINVGDEGDDGLYDDDDDDDDEDEDDEELFSSFIDTVDELVYFATKLKGIYENEPQVYQQLVGTLSPADQQAVQAFINNAQARAAAAQAAAAAPK